MGVMDGETGESMEEEEETDVGCGVCKVKISTGILIVFLLMMLLSVI